MEKKVSYVVQGDDLPCTVEFLLKCRIGLSKAQIKSAKFRPLGICVNGLQVRITDRVQTGSVLEVLLECEEDYGQKMEATFGVLDILYEDEDLIVINKAAGVAVHPAHGHYKDTLANHLLYYFEQQKKKVTIRAVGRLDKDTSGIVIFAKNKVAAARIRENFSKEYIALVWGHLKEKCGCIELPMAKKAGELNKMEISKNGNFARTHYQVLQEYETCSLVRLWLDTGRTHQIRVHMAALGHPLVGDPIYGDKAESDSINGRKNLISRAALHCKRMELIQPFTGERVCIEAPLPEDLQNVMT